METKYISRIIAAGALFMSTAVTSTAAYADNKAARDRDVDARGRLNSANITAQDQPTDTQQTQLIADIRKAIVADDSLSTRAHNVVIVAKGPSHVAMRGEVESMAEKTRVMEIAGTYASHIDSTLTVIASEKRNS